MHERVSWWVELAVKPGRLANFVKLTGEMVAAARVEAGILAYQRFVSDDGQVVYVYERYEDSAAAVAHLRKFDETFDHRFTNMIDRRRFVVFGNPSEDLKRLLDRYGASYLNPLGPFAYWG